MPHPSPTSDAAQAYHPYMPPLEAVQRYLAQTYARGYLTNHGPLVQSLEERLAAYLGVPGVIVVASGTLALQLAVRLLRLRGQVLTSPLSFVATSNAMAWEGLRPVYADVSAQTLQLDVAKARQRLMASPREPIAAIAGVHWLGLSGDLPALHALAKEHGCKLILDASQAFGQRHGEASVLDHGDISTLSFHATKVFHCVEGGALVIREPALWDEARRLRSHGRHGTGHVAPSLGINAKMSEWHAAMGHAVLDRLPALVQHFEALRSVYRERLTPHLHSGLVQVPAQALTPHTHNIYLPVVMRNVHERIRLEQGLAAIGVVPRRYFDPPLHQLPHLSDGSVLPIAESLATRMVILPIPPHCGPDLIHRMMDVVDRG